MKKNIVTIAIGIIVVLLVTAVVVIIISEDKSGPEITFNIPDGQQISYTSGQDKQVLVKYAKAVDSKDGDVSDSIMIEEIYVASDLTTANAVFVARDKNNNITKVSKEVKYIASKEETEELRKLSENATAKSAQSATTSATVAGTTKAEEKTTTASAKPVLTLSKTEATITQGSNFNAAANVKEITDDKDDRDTLFRRIIVTGYNNATAAAGEYTLSIYCTDTDGNSSNIEKFTLHVQAAKQEATVAPASTPDPTPTSDPTLTSDPTPTPTSNPTPTPDPIQTPDSTPTPTPTPNTPVA